MNADPLVLQYTGDEPFRDEAAARQYLDGYDQFTRFRMGRMAMIRKEDEAGWAGVGCAWMRRRLISTLVSRIFRQYWGKGYASEAAQASAQYGWSIGLQGIIGRAVLDNSASIRVLEKVGMKKIAIMDFHGLPGVVYEVLRPAAQ
ncbi:MAG: GNAT family N-acetyltransferase [Saprospiraceae bacterium]|nr:GNAT family N-acetyltransferase [Saprospiraceae bacterium]